MLSAAAAYACTCGSYPTTCQSLQSASVAFVGAVIESTAAGRPARLAVNTVIRGLPPQTPEIRVNPDLFTSCSFDLKTAERWLIFGSVAPNDPSVVITGTCSGSHHVSPSDTSLIDSYLHGPNLVYGVIRLQKGWDSNWRNDNLMTGVEVKLTNPFRTWSATTGPNGRFQVRNLPPGEYKLSISKSGLSPELPTSRFEVPKTPDKIVLSERGCVEVPILMWPDTAVTGLVRDANGRPIRGVEVAAYEWDGAAHRRIARRAVTAEDGRYTLARLLPGRYVIGLDEGSPAHRAYPAAFHPAATVFHARPVSVEVGKNTQDVNVTVHPQRKIHSVRVQVTWPGHPPPERAFVDAHSDKEPRVSAPTNAGGIAFLSLFEGVDYTVTATVYDEASYRSKPLRITAGSHHDLTLILSPTPEPRPWH